LEETTGDGLEETTGDEWSGACGGDACRPFPS
jgi:hypothetical protein